MSTKIEKTAKGYVARVQYADGVKVNSSPFPERIAAQVWLSQFYAAQV